MVGTGKLTGWLALLQVRLLLASEKREEFPITYSIPVMQQQQHHAGNPSVGCSNSMPLLGTCGLVGRSRGGKPPYAAPSQHSAWRTALCVSLARSARLKKACCEHYDQTGMRRTRERNKIAANEHRTARTCRRNLLDHPKCRSAAPRMNRAWRCCGINATAKQNETVFRAQSSTTEIRSAFTATNCEAKESIVNGDSARRAIWSNLLTGNWAVVTCTNLPTCLCYRGPHMGTRRSRIGVAVV